MSLPLVLAAAPHAASAQTQPTTERMTVFTLLDFFGGDTRIPIIPSPAGALLKMPLQLEK
jgi:hypothetical protein